MKKETKPKSRLMEAVHETVSDFYCLGFISARKMRRYDALCLEPVPAQSGEKNRSGNISSAIPRRRAS